MPDKSKEHERASSALPQGISEPLVLTASVFTIVASSFLNLPADLHYLIISRYLPWHAVLALRQTCKYFSTLLSPPRVQILRQCMTLRFVHDENEVRRIWHLPKWWVRSYNQDDALLGLHCYSCMRQLHPADFVRNQTMAGWCLGGQYAARRWCKACGLKWGLVRHGYWYRECRKQQRSVRLLWYSDLNNYCAKCFEEPAMAWWGCAGCFEKEERRRQREDCEAAPMGFSIVLTARQKWRNFRAAWKTKNLARQRRGSIECRVRCHPLVPAERRAFRTEDQRDREELRSLGDNISNTATDKVQRSRGERWQTRCLKCWEPNSRPRRPRISLTSAVCLPRDKWCEECIADEAYFVERQKLKKIVQPKQTP